MCLLSEWEGENQSPQDLHRKFAGTYIKGKVADTSESVFFRPNVYRIDAIGDGFVQLSHPDFTKSSVVVHQKLFDILQTLPNKGVYQLGNKVLLYQTRPARQWADGLSTANSVITINNETELKSRIERNIAEALFAEQQDITLEAGLSKIKSGECLRLNRMYWLKAVDQTTTLMRFRARIGSWALAQFFWVSQAKMLREELKDELNFHA